LASRLPGERPLLETNGDILWTQQRSSELRSESMLYTRHMAVWVTKGLLNNMVGFFLHKNFKAWWTNRVTFLAHTRLWRCMSSKQNTTPDFRLVHRSLVNGN